MAIASHLRHCQHCHDLCIAITHSEVSLRLHRCTGMPDEPFQSVFVASMHPPGQLGGREGIGWDLRSPCCSTHSFVQCFLLRNSSVERTRTGRRRNQRRRRRKRVLLLMVYKTELAQVCTFIWNVSDQKVLCMRRNLFKEEWPRAELGWQTRRMSTNRHWQLLWE